MDFSLYIHYPFCLRKCNYCAFASIPAKNTFQQAFHPVLHEELRYRSNNAPWAGGKAVTLYFGGGTPSLAPVDFIAQVISVVRDKWNLPLKAEITLEANPTTAEINKFRALRKAGVNRLSMGAQSFHDSELMLLGRTHSNNEIYNAVQIAREVGFDNISLDLIYGAPGMTIDTLSQSVDKFLELNLEHLSTYSLSIEPNTPFAKKAAVNSDFKVDPDQSADQYALICEKLCVAGYEHYELTNFAKPGLRSRHNYRYWLRTPYLGLGPSAHSFDGKRRFWNNNQVVQYIEDISQKGDAVVEFDEVTDKSEIEEIIYLGLRCREGVDVSFAEQHLHSGILRDFLSEGILYTKNERIQVSEAYWLLLDEIALRLRDG